MTWRSGTSWSTPTQTSLLVASTMTRACPSRPDHLPRTTAGNHVADSRAWWNRAAREDASWYIATASDPFLERGRRDTDELVAFCGLQPSRDRTLLEIGAGLVA
jgi:hypothetical protein